MQGRKRQRTALHPLGFDSFWQTLRAGSMEADLHICPGLVRRFPIQPLTRSVHQWRYSST